MNLDRGSSCCCSSYFVTSTWEPSACLGSPSRSSGTPQKIPIPNIPDPHKAMLGSSMNQVALSEHRGDSTCIWLPVPQIHWVLAQPLHNISTFTRCWKARSAHHPVRYTQRWTNWHKCCLMGDRAAYSSENETNGFVTSEALSLHNKNYCQCQTTKLNISASNAIVITEFVCFFIIIIFYSCYQW